MNALHTLWINISRKNKSKIKWLLDGFQGKWLTPDEIQELQEQSIKWSFNYTWTVFSVYLLTDIIRRGFPEFDPFLGVELPDIIHSFLQAIHNITVNSADSKLLKDHFPFILLWLSLISWIWEFANSKWLKQKLEATKDRVQNLLDEWEMNYAMKEWHSAIFAGEWDFLADLLQSTLPSDEAMYYSTSSPDEDVPVWQNLDDKAWYEEFKKRLDTWSFASAGEAILFPVKQSEMFLPWNSKDSFDMSLPEIKSYISMLDRYCWEVNISKKKVVIVWASSLFQDYKNSSWADIRDNLWDFIDEMNGRIDLIDPTELVFNELKQRTQWKNIIFHASSEDYDKYYSLFQKEAEKYNLPLSVEEWEDVHINYNTSDVFSLHNDEINKGNNILIILDPSIYDSAVSQVGIDNIIYVPDLVNTQLEKITDITTVR